VSQATQEVVSRIPLTTADEFRAAVDAARTAFPGWRGTPVTTRQRVMFKFQELIRANMVTLCLIDVLVVSFDAARSLFW
jgi:acyl-CoA reductase-like NAD-dependent aldehyde dehydrogenase